MIWLSRVSYDAKKLLKHVNSHTLKNQSKKIIENINNHTLMNQNILLIIDFSCSGYFKKKLIIEQSLSKVVIEYSIFIQRTQGDICEPIHLPCDLFSNLWF